MKAPTVLITGVAGFIGSHLAEALLSQGRTVVGVDNFDPYYDPAIKRGNVLAAAAHPKFRLHEVDICDADALLAVFREARPDVVVHLAARAGVRPSLENPELYHDVNVIGTQHVLDAARDVEPGHLVLASSSSVYSGCTETPFRETMAADRPLSPYAATKRMTELMAHVYHNVYGLHTTLLRFFTVYGPRQRPDMAMHKFARLIVDGKPIPMFGRGDTLRDYTYIDDIVDGVVRAIDRPFPYEIINLGASRTTNLRAMIGLLAAALGRVALIDELPPQPGDATVTQAEVSKARELLGYVPSIEVPEGIEKFAAWYLEGEERLRSTASG